MSNELKQRVEKCVQTLIAQGKMENGVSEIIKFLDSVKENYSVEELNESYEYFMEKYSRYKRECYLPKESIEFLKAILKTKDETKNAKTCCDLCSDYGDISIQLSKTYENVKGYDINPEMIKIAKMNAALHGVDNIEFEQKNILKDNINKKFDIVISNPPFSLKWVDLSKNKEELGYENLTADAAFIEKALGALNDGGISCVITTQSVLYSGLDKEFRKNLIDNKYLKEIILMPTGTFYNTGLEPVILVMTKTENKHVVMIDLRKCNKKVGHNYSLDEKISSSYYIQTMARTNRVVYKKIVDNDYLLSPGRYDSEKIVVKNMQKLLDVCSIIPGYQYTTKTIKEKENGSVKIVKISNIKSNKVCLENLASADIDFDKEKADKYLLQDGDVLVSVKGDSYVCGIVENIGDNKIIAHTNLAVLRPNKDKICPRYLLIDMLKDTTHKQIENMQVGIAIKSIPIKDLENAKISVPEIKKQKLKAAKIFNLFEKIEQLENEMKVVKDRVIFFVDEVEE